MPSRVRAMRSGSDWLVASYCSSASRRKERRERRSNCSVDGSNWPAAGSSGNWATGRPPREERGRKTCESMWRGGGSGARLSWLADRTCACGRIGRPASSAEQWPHRQRTTAIMRNIGDGGAREAARASQDGGARRAAGGGSETSALKPPLAKRNS
eukprot:scaffold4884_cov122-Isochrysis_galbana.AAC.3